MSDEEDLIQAQSADGKMHVFPPGTPQDAIDRAMRSYARTVQDAATKSDSVDLAGHAKSALTGVADAATGLVGLPGEVGSLISQTPLGKHVAIPQLPTREGIKKWFGEQTGGSLYKPETIGQEYTRSAAEGATSLFNPFKPASFAMPALGALSGVGGEAATQAMPTNPAARFAGESPFLATALALMGKKPQSAKMMSDWVKGQEPAIRAADLQAKAASEALGTKVLLPQAMGEGPLMDLMQLVKAHPRGSEVTDLLKAQQVAGKEKSLGVVEGLSPRSFVQENANSVVNAAQKAELQQPGESMVDFLDRSIDSAAAMNQTFPKSVMKKGAATFDQLTGKLENLDPRDVRAVAANLNAAGPEAFPLLVKKTLKDAWDKAQGANPLESLPRLWRGAPATEQRARFDAFIEEAAKANKLDPKEARKAANELMDAMEVASKGQGSISVGKKLEEEAGNTMISAILKSVGFNAPFHRAGFKLDKYNYDKVVEGFLEAMTSENMMKKLIDLSRYQNLTHKSKAVARAMISGGIQEQGR